MVAVPALLAGMAAVAEAPDTAELFVVANEAAGIDAPHRSSWAEFVHDVFTGGYLGIGQAWGDYDGAGFLDLFVADWRCYPECPLEPVVHRLMVVGINAGNGRVDMHGPPDHGVGSVAVHHVLAAAKLAPPATR